jgi:hypothetical protein
MKLTHVKLFEEFSNDTIQTKQNNVKEPAPNPFDAKKIFKLLILLTKGSSSTKNISKIKKEGNKIFFTFLTDQPNDDMNDLLKFKVSMESTISSITVQTFDGKKQIATSNLEITGENDIEVIVNNYLDFTNIYNDGPINSIVNNVLSIHSVSDIKKIIADQNTDVETIKMNVDDTNQRIKLVNRRNIADS